MPSSYASLNFRQRGQDFLCRIPNPVMALAQFLQTRVIEAPCLMYPAGELEAIILFVFM